MLYKDLKGEARNPTDDLILKIMCCRNQHSMAFQIPSASKDADIASFLKLSGTRKTSLIF